jgi:hypothetical protein
MEYIDQSNCYFSDRPSLISKSTDSLEGYYLRDGDKIKVQWEDGSITEEVVCCEILKTTKPTCYSYGDVTITKAYIDVNYKGNTIKVYLRDSDLLCERIK